MHTRSSQGPTRNVASLFGLLFLSVLPLLAVNIALGAQQSPPGVSYEGQPVMAVELVARPTMNVDSVRSLVVQQAGKPYSNEQIQKSIAALQATGNFSKVDVSVTPQAGGIRVEFILEPAYYLAVLDFPGATEAFSYSQLRQVVNYPDQEPYEKDRVDAGTAALNRFFAHSGYFEARVQSETVLDHVHQLATVIYRAKLGRRARFGQIQVVGPPSAEVDRLQRELRSVRARLHGANMKPGLRYDQQRLHAAVTFLQRELGNQNYLASQVRLGDPQYDPASNRAAVEFKVTIGPTVVVNVTGARVSRRTLKNLLPIYEENAVDLDLVEEGRRNLISYFQGKGYFDVTVTPHFTREPAQTTLSYAIERGNKHRVESVALTGNRHFDQGDLQAQILVKKARFFSRGKFSQDLLNTSVKNLEAFYHNAGFEDATVTPRVVDHDPKVDVTLAINEGPQTMVESLEIDGNKSEPVSALAPQGLQVSKGKPYSQYRLDQDRNQIVSVYLNEGYPSVTFRSTVKRLPGDSHRVAVAYNIEEGPQVRISQVTYVGQRHTRTRLIARAADVRAGRKMSEGDLLSGESNLYNLGVFDWADVSPRRQITDQKSEEVLVRVHEAKRNSITYGIGFESTPRSGSLSTGVLILPGLPTVGLPPKFTIIEKNIISPQGSVEYTRLNMFGSAETGSISLLASSLDQKAALTYTEPHFRGLEWSALTSISAERTTQNPLFTARVGQASFQLERVLDSAKTKRLQFRYNYQHTSLTNLLILGFVPPQDTSIQLSGVSAAYIRDTRDKPLDAHKGVFQTVNFGISPKAFGSTDNVMRFFGQTSYYWQLKPWMVWANNLRLGLVSSFDGSHVPFSEQFFSGGADSFRGFPLNGAGPQGVATLCTQLNTPSSCTATITVPEGGRQLFIFNTEGRFPIPLKDGLGGVLFYDGGNVYRAINVSHFFTDYSNTVGIGLRYQTPVGPIRVDVGKNLSPVPGLKSTQVFVTLGQSF
jgi:outer membrane protein insertion porin family